MVNKVDFSLSLLFFWVKDFISVDTRFVKVSKNNTTLGFIPAGKDNQSIPLKNISSSMISSQYKLKPIILGIIVILFSLNMISNNLFLALIILLIGIGIFGSGLQNILIIQRSGTDYVIAVPFFEKDKLNTIQDSITEALAKDVDKTDLNLFFNNKEV